MPARAATQSAPVLSDLVFPFPHNWTAIIFFGMLGLLHWANAGFSFLHNHYEGYLSLFFGTVFVGAAVTFRLIRCDLGVLPGERRLRVRTKLGPLAAERSIPFTRVHGVRLFARGGESGNGSRVEILCENEDLECPPTPIPRQQALCLAVLLNVQLIKVVDDSPEDAEFTRPVAQQQPN